MIDKCEVCVYGCVYADYEPCKSCDPDVAYLNNFEPIPLYTAYLELQAENAKLRAALEVAVHWMQFWLDQQECDCPEIYHTCGRYDRERELEQMKDALAKLEGGGE